MEKFIALSNQRTKCDNSETTLSNPISSFTEKDDVITYFDEKSGKQYCFEPKEVKSLLSIKNPFYNRNELSSEFLEFLTNYRQSQRYFEQTRTEEKLEEPTINEMLDAINDNLQKYGINGQSPDPYITFESFFYHIEEGRDKISPLLLNLDRASLIQNFYYNRDTKIDGINYRNYLYVKYIESLVKQDVDMINELEPLIIRMSQVSDEELRNLNNKLLKVAAMNGDIDKINNLLEKGAKINFAAYGSGKGNREDIIIYLLEKPGNKQDMLSNAIYGASKRGHEDLVFKLLEMGADIDDATIGAAQKNNRDLLEKLFDRGADKRVAAEYTAEKNNKELLESFLTSEMLDYAVRGAARGGYDVLVENLIDRGATINAAIDGAAQGNHEYLVYLYLGRGADIIYAVEGAAENANVDLLKDLLDMGGNVNVAIKSARKHDQESLVTWLNIYLENLTNEAKLAAKEGNTEKIQKYFERGVSIDELVEGAASGGNLRIVDSLIKEGADINFAVRGFILLDRVDFVKEYLNKGASVKYAINFMENDIRVRNQLQPLYYRQLMQFLNKYHEILNKNLLKAASKNDEKAVFDFIKRGADIKYAFEGAHRGNNVELFEMLSGTINSSASFNRRNFSTRSMSPSRNMSPTRNMSPSRDMSPARNMSPSRDTS